MLTLLISAPCSPCLLVLCSYPFCEAFLTPYYVLRSHLMRRQAVATLLVRTLFSSCCRRDLTCMNHHYETQPVPNPAALYLHHNPEILHKIEVPTSSVLRVQYSVFTISFVFYHPSILVTKGLLILPNIGVNQPFCRACCACAAYHPLAARSHCGRGYSDSLSSHPYLIWQSELLELADHAACSLLF